MTFLYSDIRQNFKNRNPKFENHHLFHSRGAETPLEVTQTELISL